MFFAHVLAIVFAVSSTITFTQAKAVFAHFIIGNTAATTYDDWVDDIQKAKAAHIDGFALNIAPLDTYMDNSLNNAYKAANAVGGFNLFLSFDFLSHGTWSNDNIIQHINTYKNQPSQYRYNGQPFVSTFEGSDRVDDWASIKAATGCFFMPSWTSLQGNSFPTDKVDGAFSWDAWPHGPRDKNATTDETWQTILKGKPYMMGVSPWFYTNIPEWSKNWLWRGDDLWHDRWQQVIELQPELVEIITWNDYGESHYIGPIRPGVPTGAQRYVDDMPHDNWRDILPHYIDAYKSGNTTAPAIAADNEKLVFWYRLNPSRSGSSGGTTGNSPAVNPNDPVYDPALVSQDKVFLTVLVASPADVSVQIGGGAVTALRATTSGINHFSVPFNGQTGKVAFEVKRNGQCVVKAEGPPITAACADGLVNWNAFVGGSS